MADKKYFQDEQGEVFFMNNDRPVYVGGWRNLSKKDLQDVMYNVKPNSSDTTINQAKVLASKAKATAWASQPPVRTQVPAPVEEQ